jgi:exopolyphosphatase/guanosine-5'-triphosphate,3'-diphosphate pyrophosphatase
VPTLDSQNNPISLAGIDIGSNTFRLLAARFEKGKLIPIVKKLITVRLSENLAATNLLSDAALKRAGVALEQFADILTQIDPQHVRVCGTAALRVALNSDSFLALADKTLGYPIEILSGEQEANLSMKGSIASLETQAESPLLLADVGGGSTELVYIDHRPVTEAKTYNQQPTSASIILGVVGLTENFLKKQRPSPEEIDTLTTHIKDHLVSCTKSMPLPRNIASLILVGSGGTATSMAALDLGLVKYDAEKIQNHSLSKERVEKLWQQLIKFPAEERNNLPGLGEGRGEIIVAGVRIYQVLLELLTLDHLVVSDAGLLEGIALSCVI